jgi:putative salt-induced outer membrane protein YdiY
MNRHSFIVATVVMSVAAATTATEPEREAIPEKSPWSGSAALGLTLTKGNSDTVLVTLGADARGEWQKDIWSLGGSLTYGEQDVSGKSETTAQNAGGFIQYQRLINERLFGSIREEAFHDKIADVDYRVITSPAIGYFFIKREQTRLSGEAGPSYVVERLGADTRARHFFTARLAERLEHSFSETWKVWQQLEWLPQVDKFSNYLLNAEVGTEVALNAWFSLRVVLQDKFDNQPAEGRKKNDLTLITSLAYKY